MSTSSHIHSIDIVYFSWSGNTKSVVDVIEQELKPEYHRQIKQIIPRPNYPYLIWLLLSFIPGVGARIDRQEISSPFVILAMPKWTVNCPPITSFLRKGYLQSKNVFLVITYGGFDQNRYAESYRNKIEKVSGGVKKVLLVKRKDIQEGNLTAVREWAAEIRL